MSVNNTTKSAEDLVKCTTSISFQFYFREYMHCPEMQEQIELLQDFLRAAGFRGVRLIVQVNLRVSFINQMHEQSSVTGERGLFSWGGKLLKSASIK